MQYLVPPLPGMFYWCLKKVKGKSVSLTVYRPNHSKVAARRVLPQLYVPLVYPPLLKQMRKRDTFTSNPSFHKQLFVKPRPTIYWSLIWQVADKHVYVCVCRGKRALLAEFCLCAFCVCLHQTKPITTVKMQPRSWTSLRLLHTSSATERTQLFLYQQ